MRPKTPSKPARLRARVSRPGKVVTVGSPEARRRAFQPPTIGVYPVSAALARVSQSETLAVGTFAGLCYGKNAQQERSARKLAQEHSERNAMIFWRFVGVVLACAPLLLAPVRAQEAAQQP